MTVDEASRSRLFLAAAAGVPLLALVFGACNNDRLRQTLSGVEVVGGEPGVGQGLPGIDRGDGGPDGSVFGSAAPYQVDGFTQQQIQQVDILWVIDDSPGMLPKQSRVIDNFHSFIQFLSQQQIDYHLGVTTTDIFDPTQSGRLVNTAGLPQPWIELGSGNPQVSFVQNATVGTNGSPTGSHGLLAGMFALTAPLSPATPQLPSTGAANCAQESDGGVACFRRPGVPLYTIIISDDEDSSCAPIYTDSDGYLSGQGCDNAKANGIGFPGGYGSIEYWTRFYAGIGGESGTSKLAVIASTDTTIRACSDTFASDCTQFNVASACAGNAPDCNNLAAQSHPCCQALAACNADVHSKQPNCNVFPLLDTNNNPVSPYFTISGNFAGCVSTASDGGVEFTAFAAPRYVAVAQGTGGIATSICDQDYTPALSKLGLQAAGLRADFPLSRAPIPTSVAVLVDGVAPAATAWTYVRCDGNSVSNVIRFATPPHAGAKVSVSYDVNVRGLGACP